VSTAAIPTRAAAPWLFSRGIDLSLFVGSAALSCVVLAAGWATGTLHEATPDWAWVPLVLLVDVAHVWSTAYRTYLDPVELRRRPLLYGLTPPLAFAGAWLAYRMGERTFWRLLAYFAIFHFVRQQYGWVVLYRARAGERHGAWLDGATIYAATLWPMAYWHAHAPRRFDWFVSGDILPLWPRLADATLPVYAALLVAYAVRSARAWLAGRANPGKDAVVLTTAVTWLVGIVLFDSDFAFTATNVFAHGVPYIALVFFYVRDQQRIGYGGPAFAQRAAWFLGLLWLIAYAEELVWDRAVWQEHAWLFGEPWSVGAAKEWLVPLLVLPQLSHYVLDGFIWKRGKNPDVHAMVEASAAR
jgi:hypothetical protein